MSTDQLVPTVDLNLVFEQWINSPRLIARMKRERARYGSFISQTYSDVVTSKSKSNRSFCHTQRMLDRVLTVYHENPTISQLKGLLTGDSVNILDFGCGLGHASLNIATCIPNARIGFIDITIHRERFAAHLRDLLGLEPLTEYTVDLVIATEVLEHMEDPLACIQYLDSRLRTGGVLVTNVADHEPSTLHISCDLSVVREFLTEHYDTISPERIYVKHLSH